MVFSLFGTVGFRSGLLGGVFIWYGVLGMGNGKWAMDWVKWVVILTEDHLLYE